MSPFPRASEQTKVVTEITSIRSAKTKQAPERLEQPSRRSLSKKLYESQSNWCDCEGDLLEGWTTW